MSTTRLPPIDRAVYIAVTDLLADWMGTHAAVTQALIDVKCDKYDPGRDNGFNMRDRLFNALTESQNRSQCSNALIRLITNVMAPALYTDRMGELQQRQGAINERLAFAGLMVRGDGRVIKTQQAKTLDEAMERVNSMLAVGKARGWHRAAITACTPEVLGKNWFHASLEAVKGVMLALRSMTGLDTDGAALIDAALGGKDPILAVADLTTESGASEQRGLAMVIKGLTSMYRNPTAHDSAREREVTEQDFRDLLDTLSMVYRRLDRARRVTR